MRLAPSLALAPAVLFSQALLAPSLPCQTNTIPGLAAAFADAGSLFAAGRQGTFPTGRSGLGMSTTICNNGTLPITWLAPMNNQHPMYAFLVCCEQGGRFVQISDRSFLKHSFGSANSNFCGTCIPPPNGNQQVGVNCSDTYGASTNADRFWLGPLAEVDPWLNAWQPIGSYFDRGDPDVGAPANHDGVRSLTATMANTLPPVANRVVVRDQDLNLPGARFFYGGYLLVLGEAEPLREDNLVHRSVTPFWNGAGWTFQNPGAVAHGTILTRWTDATVTSTLNAGGDGRVYTAVVVTPRPDGRWHYEYAVHNRDNGRGLATFRVPVCPTARVTGAGSRDLDQDPLNDWTAVLGGGEVAFQAGANNALEWNTIHNFWFDCDAAPVAGTIRIDEARPGAGAPQLLAGSTVPGRLGSEQLGAGCGSPAPTLAGIGTPALPAIPNASFAVRVGAHPATGVFVFTALGAVSVPLGGGCTQYVDPVSAGTLAFAVTDGSGVLRVAQPIPADPSLEGLDLVYQAAELWAGGPAFSAFNVSGGLRVRVGNARSGCP